MNLLIWSLDPEGAEPRQEPQTNTTTQVISSLSVCGQMTKKNQNKIGSLNAYTTTHNSIDYLVNPVVQS